jgi:hypothetical protein
VKKRPIFLLGAADQQGLYLFHERKSGGRNPRGVWEVVLV